MEAALREIAAGDDVDLAGVTAGAVESEFQTSRIQGMCDRLGIDLFAPLWQESPVALAEAMFEAGFEIRIVQVAAYGLDESWLGRRYDADALAELVDLREECGSTRSARAASSRRMSSTARTWTGGSTWSTIPSGRATAATSRSGTRGWSRSLLRTSRATASCRPDRTRL